MKRIFKGTVCFLLKIIFQFAFGGGIYFLMETAFRAVQKHPDPMPHVFFLGGGAFILGLLMCRIPLSLKWKIAVLPILGFVFLTIYEYYFGLYFLTFHNLRIWDYNGCNFQFDRLICLKFSLCWGAIMWLILALHLLFEKLLSNTPFSDKNIFKKSV